MISLQNHRFIDYLSAGLGGYVGQMGKCRFNKEAGGAMGVELGTVGLHRPSAFQQK